MAEARAQFESELKRKLSIKSKAEEHSLIKTFQYFDLEGKNLATSAHFQSVIEKLGIQIPPEQTKKLYDYYALSGVFNYRQFAHKLFQQGESIVFIFQKKIFAQGVDQFFGLLQQLTKEEFNYPEFRQIFAAFPEEKVRELFQYLSNQKAVNAQQLVQVLRGEAASSHLFVNDLSLDELMQHYKGASPAQVRKYLQIYLNFKKLSFVDQQTFDEFHQLIQQVNPQGSCWQGLQHQQTPKRKLVFTDDTEVSLEISRMLVQKGAKAIIQFRKLLERMDTDEDGLLTAAQLQQALREFRIKVQSESSSGNFDISMFNKVLLGDFSQRPLAEEIFAQMDSDQDGQILYSQFKQNYNAKLHPDFLNRIRSENEIIAEFLDAFDTLHQNGATNRSYVSKQEFIEYCHILFRVNREQFSKILTGVFSKINSPQPYQRASNVAPYGTQTPYAIQRVQSASQSFSNANLIEASPSSSIQSLQAQIKSLGIRGILYILRSVQRFNPATISQNLQKLRIRANDEQLNLIVKNQPEVNRKQFLKNLFGEFPQARQSAVAQVFQRMRQNELSQILGIYAGKHSTLFTSSEFGHSPLAINIRIR